MSKKIKEIPMSKRFFPALLPIIGDEKYEQVIARYQELFEKHELPQHPTLQWHLIQGILPGLAFYQIFRESGETAKRIGDDRPGIRDPLLGQFCQDEEVGQVKFYLSFLEEIH